MSIAKRLLQVVAFVCTLVVGTASLAAIITQTPWFKEWLRGFIVRQAEDYVNGRLSIGRLDGNLFFGVELGDVDITMNGKTVVDIEDVGLDFNAFTLLGGDVVLDDIRLTRPVLRLARAGQGWNLAQLIKARTPDPDEPKSRRTIEIGEIGISDGTLYIDEGVVGTSGIDAPARIERLDASVAVKSNEDELTFNVAHVSLRAAEPGFGVNSLSGVIRRTKNEIAFENVSLRTEESSLRVVGTVRNIEGSAPVLDLKASSDKLALDEIAKIIPALRNYHLQPAFEIAASGPADQLSVTLSVRDGNLGQVAGDLTIDSLEPHRRIAGTVSMEHLNVGVFRGGGAHETPSTLKSDITGNGRIDLGLPPSGFLPLHGSYTVNAGDVQVAGYEARNVVASGRIDDRVIRLDARADAYGGQATAVGTVTTGGPLAIELRGDAASVDLRNLPPALRAPGIPSNLKFAYVLTGQGAAISSDIVLDTSTIAEATIASGTTGHVDLGAGAPRYAAKGQVTNLDLQQIGSGLAVQALAADRYRSRVNGTFDMTGTGGGRYPLTLDATGTLVDSEMFGASFPTMAFTTSLMDGDARVHAAGTFTGLDPAVVTGNGKVAGMLAGTADVDTTIRGYGAGVTMDSIDVAGRIDLAGSTVAGIGIETAVIDGRYANREGQLNQASIAGSDINVTGTGTIALNETGASNLSVHAESAALDRIGEIIGQPLKGGAVVDATVTGNGRELKADGSLMGSNVGHGENEVLSLSSTFSAVMPDLTPAQARIQAKSTATFLEIGGQKINELTADTTYSQSRIDFKAVAQQEMLQLAAGGSVALQPDRQEIHVSDLALRSGQIEWATLPGAAPTIRYGGGRIQVDNLALVNGDQRITAGGVVGSPDETLQVRAENVDVALLDRLLAGQERLAGRFTGNATVSGTTDAPRVASEFTLAQGAFRMFKFDSLAGTVNYAQSGVNLDVRLQQTPTAWLTAKGYAPMTLFRANPPGVSRDDHTAAAEGEAVDIQIASSEVDLGVVQGFTSYLTNVAGVMQANVRVTGSGYDPHLDGAVDIRGGAFAIPELGTNYTGLDTRIELQPDGVNIREFKILDNRGFPLTIGGTLAVHARSVGAVDITMQSENFEVIDNELADLKLDTQIKITGELLKPRLEGYVEVENGTIFLAPLLERVTSDPYATEATAVDLAGSDEAAKLVSRERESQAPQEAQTSLFDALELEIALGVPSNLVLRGTDLRPANAPIEMGDMNVTVGGAVQVQKSPGGRLRLVGEVNTVRGQYAFQGRSFEILRDGRIRFDGADEIDPAIDLRARRIISGVETFVRVQGTMRQPELSFSSNPPLDQAEILSLIVFNMPINELGEGQQASLAERAGALAGGYLTSGLARSIGNALELDEFEIQAQGENGAGPSLTVGEQVGEKLFLRIRQGFTDATATEFILEYQISDFLRAQGTVADTSGGAQRLTFRRVERGGIDLIFFFSY
jgi:autotransporter translocation and assembly factor TamB